MRYIRSTLALLLVVCSLAALDSCSDDNCVDPCRQELRSDPTLYFPLAVGNWWKLRKEDGELIYVMTDSIVGYEPMPFGGYCYQLARRIFGYDKVADSVSRDTLDLNLGAYEVRDNCIYYWDWDYGITLHDTIAWRLIDAPLEKGKEWDRCLPNDYVYISDPAETLRTRCHDHLLNVKYRASVTVPAGAFPRVYEIWHSGDDKFMWLAFAPGVGPVYRGSVGFGLVDYHLAE
jgi:hypothetical protein